MNFGLVSLSAYGFLGVGVSPLAEMTLLAALLIGTMWFMAVRYSAGLQE